MPPVPGRGLRLNSSPALNGGGGRPYYLITCAAVVYHAPKCRNLAAVLCLDHALHDYITSGHFFTLLLFFRFHTLFNFPPFIGSACYPFFIYNKGISLFYIVQTFYKLFAEKTHFFRQFRSMRNQPSAAVLNMHGRPRTTTRTNPHRTHLGRTRPGYSLSGRTTARIVANGLKNRAVRNPNLLTISKLVKNHLSRFFTSYFLGGFRALWVGLVL